MVIEMNKTLKLSFCALVFNSNVMAHTDFENTVLEGTQTDGYIKIAHGCTQNKYSITFQSIVVPTLNPKVIRTDGTIINLTDDINVISSSGLKGLIKPIQDKSIFAQQSVKTDNLGNIIGFENIKGNLNYNLIGRVPVQISAPYFKATSCAKKLKVKIAIADICKTSFPPVPSTANLWIPNTTSKFSSLAIEGIGEPAELVIERSSIPQICGNETYDVIVEPSNIDIDTNLPINKIWGK